LLSNSIAKIQKLATFAENQVAERVVIISVSLNHSAEANSSYKNCKIEENKNKLIYIKNTVFFLMTKYEQYERILRARSR
jgi:translation elongation factor P/translation initiation factor 5A